MYRRIRLIQMFLQVFLFLAGPRYFALYVPRWCLLFTSAGLPAHKTCVKTPELNAVFARFSRRSSKRRCWASAAQNSFLPVAGATGSHDLTWMMLKQFGLGEERWFSKKKKCLNLLFSQGELQFAAGYFSHSHQTRTHKTTPPPHPPPKEAELWVTQLSM